MTPDIYVMTEQDLSAVLDIENRVYPNPWSEGIFKDCLRSGYYGFMLKQQEQLLGYAMISVAVQECHILNICIDSQHQGKKLGHYLLEFLLEEAKQLGAKSVFLEVRSSNHVAINLYEAMGFNQLGVRKGYYPMSGKTHSHNTTQERREDALVYALELLE